MKSCKCIIHDMKIKTKFASIQRHATQWNQTNIYMLIKKSKHRQQWIRN